MSHPYGIKLPSLTLPYVSTSICDQVIEQQ